MVTLAAVWTDQACSASRVVIAHCCVRCGSLLLVARWTGWDRPTATTAGSASTRVTSALAWTRSGATSGRCVGQGGGHGGGHGGGPGGARRGRCRCRPRGGRCGGRISSAGQRQDDHCAQREQQSGEPGADRAQPAAAASRVRHGCVSTPRRTDCCAGADVTRVDYRATSTLASVRRRLGLAVWALLVQRRSDPSGGLRRLEELGVVGPAEGLGGPVVDLDELENLVGKVLAGGELAAAQHAAGQDREEDLD